jgi:hypothetical protein
LHTFHFFFPFFFPIFCYSFSLLFYILLFRGELSNLPERVARAATPAHRRFLRKALRAQVHAFARGAHVASSYNRKNAAPVALYFVVLCGFFGKFRFFRLDLCLKQNDH